MFGFTISNPTLIKPNLCLFLLLCLTNFLSGFLVLLTQCVLCVVYKWTFSGAPREEFLLLCAAKHLSARCAF